MADQDFNIKVVTTADTTGIQQTSRQLEQLKNQQVAFAETAKRQAAVAAVKPTEVSATGVTGGAIGIGAIVTLLGTVISKYKAFEDEQDKIIERMEKARVKTYELGLEVADTLEAMKSVERIDTEPLDVSFDRLTNRVRVLKTELKLAFESGAFEDSKRLIAQLRVVEAQVDRVTAAIDREKQKTEQAADAAEKLANKTARSDESFIKGAVQTAGPQVQRALLQEDAARRAEAAGDQRGADLFRKSSEQFQRSMTPAQSEEFKQLKDEMARMNVSLQMILETFR